MTPQAKSLILKAQDNIDTAKRAIDDQHQHEIVGYNLAQACENLLKSLIVLREIEYPEGDLLLDLRCHAAGRLEIRWRGGQVERFGISLAVEGEADSQPIPMDLYAAAAPPSTDQPVALFRVRRAARRRGRLHVDAGAIPDRWCSDDHGRGRTVRSDSAAC